MSANDWKIYKAKRVLVAKRDTFLDDFKGEIMEFYNSLPWGNNTGSSFPYKSASVHLACSYMNFYKHHDYFQDAFGITFHRLSYNGAWVWPDDWSLSQAVEYEVANGGYSGVLVSAGGKKYQTGIRNPDTGEYEYMPYKRQPKQFVGTNCKFIELSSNDSTSGSTNLDEYGWFAIYREDLPLPSNYRQKDMVFWLYDLSYTLDGVEFSFQQGASSDNTFSPGQTGVRKISNSYKYAPWERYPDLI